METIWKFPLKSTVAFEIEMPSGAEILTVQSQNNKPFIWAKVWDAAPLVKRKFNLFGTGHMMPIITQRREYIGTFQIQDGAFVFHLFEIKD